MLKLCTALLAVFVLAACFLPAEVQRLPDGEVTLLRTDRNSYTAEENESGGYSFTLEATLTNTTDQTFYLNLCYPGDTSPIYGVSAVEPVGESAWSPVWACVGHEENIVVAPGESRTDVLTLHAPWATESNGQVIGNLEGAFSLLYVAYPCSVEFDVACSDGQTQLSSNDFVIALP